jgi:hypothetical protein
MNKKNDINSKTSPNQMRILMGRMRTGNGNYGISETTGEKKKEMSVRDMLKITRHLDEQMEDTLTVDTEEDEKKAENKKTVFDQPEQEKEMVRLFDDNVSIVFDKLEVYDDWVFWSGVINGVIQFVFVVTRDEITSRVEFNYLKGFSKDNPLNDEILEKLQAYYDTTFSKYWRENVLQK